jgi:hypothetical protein
MVDQANNTPSRLDLNLWRGDDQQVRVLLKNGATGAEMPPQGYAWSAPIFETLDDALADVAPLTQFTVSFDGNAILLTLSRATTAEMSMGPYVWGLRGDYDGKRRTYLAGSLRLPA